jgi:hypothetical protein
MPPRKNTKLKGLEAPNPAFEYTESETEEEQVEPVTPVKQAKFNDDKADRRIICEKARQAKMMKQERLKKEKEIQMEQEIEKRLNERLKGLNLMTPSAPPPSPAIKPQKPKKPKRIIEEYSSSSSEDDKQYYPTHPTNNPRREVYYSQQNIQRRGPSPLLSM